MLDYSFVLSPLGIPFAVQRVTNSTIVTGAEKEKALPSTMCT